ncbi:MAG: aspartate/glutamate racemase family protein [Chloroflexi bacterium]|nr:aspartate/glutamate racemase family protein [Chloroflexota bacterium]
MTTPATPTIGYISANNRWGKHYDEFMKLVPDGVKVQIEGLGLYTTHLTELAGKTDVHVAKTTELAAANDWAGIAVMGAPVEVQNPDLPRKIREAVSIPVSTALDSGAAALRALGTRKALLLCPFDARLKGMLKENLAGKGVEAMLPAESFENIGEGAAQTPEQLYEMAKSELAKAPGAQAIYFQGGPMDPLSILQELEDDLGVPVIASNPTMLWRVSTQVGLKFSIPGKGALLREWPGDVAI